jgi:epoxyqueuosine reductase
MSGLNRILIEALRKHGLEAGIISVSHIDDIKEEIASLKEQSLFDEHFYNEFISSRMEHNHFNSIPGANSIIIIACPQMITPIKFEFHGKNHTVIIPPSYVYSELYEHVESIVKQLLKPYKYTIEFTRLPAKLMAVRSGIALYGKNNISYINGMGSFYRLFAFISDMPCDEGRWREAEVMPECSNCNACTKTCPTGAIDGHHFLIHAEKCITYFNELTGDFPDWFDNDWHNSLVGCMKCQLVCPRNKAFINQYEKEISFTEKDVELILENTQLEQLPCQLKEQLEKLNMMDYYNVLGRNLSALIG